MACAFEVRLEVDMFIIWELATVPLGSGPEFPCATQMSAKQNIVLKSTAHHSEEVPGITSPKSVCRSQDSKYDLKSTEVISFPVSFFIDSITKREKQCIVVKL